MILLNPGPVTLSRRVHEALDREALCHREPEFAELTLDLRGRLETVYDHCQPSHAAVLITASGTGAVEAMLATFALRQAPTLVVSNGVYGDRMAAMLERQGKPCVHVASAWTDPISIDAVVAALDADPTVARLAVVHHETTTGRLNDIDAIADVCAARDIGLLVDAVSSFGAESLSFESWHPLAVAGTAGKCLHGVPGLSFVLCRRDAFSQHPGQAPTVYLDLERYYRDQQRGWSPFTQAVQACVALREALDELSEAGGWQARHSRYRHLARQVRQSLAALGVEPLLPDRDSSAVLHGYRIPPGLTYDRIHDGLKARGFVIYAGQGDLQREVFRIAHMGAIGDDDLQRFVVALREVFGPA